jgi:hypothetical protein
MKHPLLSLSVLGATLAAAAPCAEASVFAVSAGYGFAAGTGTSVSAASAVPRESEVVFPMMFNGSLDWGSESLRMVLDGYVSYSSALAGVDLALWSVGVRWFPLNAMKGTSGESAVALASDSYALPYVLAAGGISQFSSVIRDRDGLLKEVSANSLGGFGAIGADIPLDAFLANKPRYEGFSGLVFYTEGRVMAHLLPITTPSLTTLLVSGVVGVRWRF